MAFSREAQTNYPNYESSARHTELCFDILVAALPARSSPCARQGTELPLHTPGPRSWSGWKLTWQSQVKQIKPSVGKFPSSPPPSDSPCDHEHKCASPGRAQQARGPKLCSKQAPNFLHFPAKPIKRRLQLTSCRDAAPAAALRELCWCWPPPQPQPQPQPRQLLLQSCCRGRRDQPVTAEMRQKEAPRPQFRAA